MGSLGTGRRMMVSRSPKATWTLAPGRRPIFFRRAAGITTCPLADVDTTGIDVSLSVRVLNCSEKSITPPWEEVKGLARVDRAGQIPSARAGEASNGRLSWALTLPGPGFQLGPEWHVRDA